MVETDGNFLDGSWDTGWPREGMLSPWGSDPRRSSGVVKALKMTNVHESILDNAAYKDQTRMMVLFIASLF